MQNSAIPGPLFRPVQGRRVVQQQFNLCLVHLPDDNRRLKPIAGESSFAPHLLLGLADVLDNELQQRGARLLWICDVELDLAGIALRFAAELEPACERDIMRQ